MASCKKRIDQAIQGMQDYVSLSRRLSAANRSNTLLDDYEQIFKKFMREMSTSKPASEPLEQTESWSISELESIVYDFITYKPKDCLTDSNPRDVSKEDLMKIQRLDKKSVEEKPLPQMIREYILHDRGNSIFLGDSFANLPSPVAEGQTIKNLFKFNEDDDEKKLERERDKEKDKNEIRIEGKPDKKKAPKQESPGKKELNMKQIEEIDKIVFEDTVVKLPIGKGNKSAKAVGKQATKQAEPEDLMDIEMKNQRDAPDPYNDLLKTRLSKNPNDSFEVNPT